MVLSWTGAGATVTFPSQTEGNSQWEQLSALKRTRTSGDVRTLSPLLLVT